MRGNQVLDILVDAGRKREPVAEVAKADLRLYHPGAPDGEAVDVRAVEREPVEEAREFVLAVIQRLARQVLDEHVRGKLSATCCRTTRVSARTSMTPVDGVKTMVASPGGRK